MPNRFLCWTFVLYLLLAAGQGSAQQASVDVTAYRSFEGFIDTWWDEDTGRMLVRVEALDEPFIYQTSLPRGMGSNDIGLDRGQLGSNEGRPLHAQRPEDLACRGQSPVSRKQR